MRAINLSSGDAVLTTFVEPHSKWTHLTEPDLVYADVELVAEQWMQYLASISLIGTDAFGRWNNRWTIGDFTRYLILWSTFLMFFGEPQLTAADHRIGDSVRTLEEAVAIVVVGYEGQILGTVATTFRSWCWS